MYMVSIFHCCSSFYDIILLGFFSFYDTDAKNMVQDCVR